jgi:hypothetical protein
VDVAVFMLVHVAISVGTVDGPLSLNLSNFSHSYCLQRS